MYRSDQSKIDALSDALILLSLAVREQPELFSMILPSDKFDRETYETVRLEPSLAWNFYAWSTDEFSEAKAKLSRLARLVGTNIGKYADDYNIGFEVNFRDAIVIRVVESRSDRCEQVPTGETKTVTRTRTIVPAVVEEYTEEVPIMEWVCPDSLLSTKED